MNEFDFYVVRASAGTVGALTRAGIERAKVERRRDGVAVYGRRVFPRWRYVATLGFFELSQAAAADELAASWRARGVAATVNYHAAD